MKEIDIIKCVPILKPVTDIELLVSQGQIKIKKYAKGESLYKSRLFM